MFPNKPATESPDMSELIEQIDTFLDEASFSDDGTAYSFNINTDGKADHDKVLKAFKKDRNVQVEHEMYRGDPYDGTGVISVLVFNMGSEKLAKSRVGRLMNHKNS
jgi:hypothetical protein